VRSKSGTSASTAKSRAAHLDRLLDEALEETFPASDPIAISIEKSDDSPTSDLSGPRPHRKTAAFEVEK
jgi:hypothetical protein